MSNTWPYEAILTSGAIFDSACASFVALALDLFRQRLLCLTALVSLFFFGKDFSSAGNNRRRHFGDGLAFFASATPRLFPSDDTSLHRFNRRAIYPILCATME